MDFWQPPGRINNTVDMLVSPEQNASLHALLTRNGLQLTTEVSNIEPSVNISSIVRSEQVHCVSKEKVLKSL